MRERVAFGLFLGFFAAYVFTMPGYLAPYRDAGEMATSAATLGVSHPPSYPLYILLGKLSQALPFGSAAYRLTLLSALCAAGAVAALFLVLEPLAGIGAAALAALWLGCNRTFWSVAIVGEMYSLSLLQAIALLGLALRLRRSYDRRLWRGFAFLYGLSLANRTDLLLWAPGLFWLVFSAGRWRDEEGEAGGWILRSIPWALLGLSVYLYLPIRSAAGPWLDWNHPARLDNLIGSLTRRSYGGTLDLLSKNYAPGELFGENLRAYARHLWGDYLGAGVWLPLAGLWAAWRRDRGEALGLLLAGLASGPLFLFLANLPPNPHALAIVEPHYLLCDVVLAAFAALGAAALAEAQPRVPAAALVLLGLAPLWHRWDVSRRWHLHNYDYTRNVWLSTPRGATLVAKKDVPLFSLWYAREVEGLRRDVRLVAQGLSGSPWYQEARRRLGEPGRMGPLRSAEDWDRFAALNEALHFTTDCEVPEGIKGGPARGLVIAYSTAAATTEAPWTLMSRRGGFDYDEQPDFFHSDIVDAYVMARQRMGSWLIDKQELERAARPLLLGWAMKWHLPDAPMFLAFAEFSAGRLPEALSAYAVAARLFERTLELATAYRSLPPIFSGARRGIADARLNMGVALERQGKRDEAERQYRLALQSDPRAAQAHFNLAVLYWDRDWAVVASEMGEVLKLDPARQDAMKYLAIARQKQKK
ncbi:MAG: DUF2723 domain-containing protein [Elusimicrobia bacterium]|nr:DUF2723 domain-containing protein [Elusimicrobiota bacterium]